MTFSIYARLLDHNKLPIQVPTFPAVFCISQKAHTDLPLGRYVRAVGNVPHGFAYWHGVEKYYRVELEPTEPKVQRWLEQTMALPSCSINRITIQLENSVGLGHNQIGNGQLAFSTITHDIECTECNPKPISH